MAATSRGSLPQQQKYKNILKSKKKNIKAEQDQEQDDDEENDENKEAQYQCPLLSLDNKNKKCSFVVNFKNENDLKENKMMSY